MAQDHAQWSDNCLTTGFPEKKNKTLLCQFPWCKCSRHGQFQATNVTFLNVQPHRDVHIGAVSGGQAGASTPLVCGNAKTDIQSPTCF